MKRFLWILLFVIACNGEKKEADNQARTPQKEDIVVRYPNGVVKFEGRMLNGKRDGKWTYYYESGIKWSEGIFKKGERTGSSIVYYESGKKKLEGRYEKNNRVGKWKVWEEDGSLAHIVNMDSLLNGQDSIINQAESLGK